MNLSFLIRHKYVCSGLRSIVFILTLFALAGCDFDPNEHVHSGTCPPEHRTEDGVWWSAIKCSGDNDEWFYVPVEAAIVTHNCDLTNGRSLKLLLDNGRIYQITKDTSGGYIFDGFVEADFSANPGMVIFAVILGLIAIVCIFVAGGAIASADAKKQKLAAKNEKLATAEAECDEIRSKAADEREEFLSEKQAFEDLQRSTEDRNAAERQAADAEREELEQQKKTNAVASRDAALKPRTPTPTEWEAASETVRARAFSGQAVGNGLVINYFFDPRRSGMIRFHWEITLDRSVSPKIVAYRDGRKFHEESGLVKNEFNDRLLLPDRRYKYKFKLFSGTKALPDPVVFELIVPPFAAWEPTQPKPDSDAERRRKKEAWKQNQYRYAESYISDPAKLKAKKAEIDEEANSKFKED